ncbi:MAG: J domain-containing protein [Miltoncostaeaceae bacterium]
MSAGPDHYAALDVAPDASAAEVRAAWRLRLVAFHPDRFRDEDQRRRAEELTQRANEAWQVLGDPVQRSRYDRLRRSGPQAPPPGPPAPPVRRVPCPGCASRVAVDDPGGIVVSLRCPGCGQGFSALVGARVVGRAHLERRWRSRRHRRVVASARGALDTVTFRKLPIELALSEGELVSIVFHPTRGRPVYTIAHDEGGLDLGWRVR